MQHLNDVPEDKVEIGDSVTEVGRALHAIPAGGEGEIILGRGDLHRTPDDAAAIKAGVARRMKEILTLLGYDTTDQHFQRTPERVAQVLWEFHHNGRQEDLAKLLEVSFSDVYQSLVQVGPVTFTSMAPKVPGGRPASAAAL